MIIFPAQVLASVEHILQLLVGCIIDLSSEHFLVFCHLSLFLSFFLSVCLIVQRTPLTLLPFALPRSLFRISWVVAAGAWEGGERYKGTSICRYLLDVPFHISLCEDFIIQERYLHIVIYFVNLQLGRTYHRFCRIKIYLFFYIYVKILLII